VAQAWQLTSANAITRLSDVGYTGNSLAITVPSQSITMLVLPSGAANLPPNAVLTATPTSGIAPLTVNFNASGSSDPDGSISNYAWSFGDGGTSSGASATASHTYSAVGTYTAKVTVTDNRGSTGSATVTITAMTDPNIIAAPSNLTGSAGRGSASLTWKDNSNNETGFHIERAVSGSSNYAVVGNVGANATSYSESVAKGNYSYRVQAYDTSTGRTSAYSNVVTVRVK
jgi:PKD repeat protein